MQIVQYDYFRGMDAEQHSFYRVPKLLFTSECFKPLSCEAKVLYGLMLDRMSLSIKNRWFDNEERAYIIFTVDDIMELMNCGRQKAVKCLAELDTDKGIGLIEKKRLGLGKPNIIYVKSFVVKDVNDTYIDDDEFSETSRSAENAFLGVQKSSSQKYDNQTSERMLPEFPEVPLTYFSKYQYQNPGSMLNELPEVSKSKCNYTNTNKTDNNETNNINPNPINPDMEEKSMMEVMDVYRAIIHENISYECFIGSNYYRQEEIDELVELMLEVIMMPNKALLRIGGTSKQAVVVKSQFLKLNQSHIEYVISCLQKNTTKVGNIKAYLLTTLFNAPMTIGNYYRAEVNHDMYGGGKM